MRNESASRAKKAGPGFPCEKCGARFPTNQKLQRHLARKRPCDPILDREALPAPQRDSRNRCEFCGRAYSRPDSLKRHLAACRIATSEDGRERLYAHSLKKQKARFEEELAKRDAAAADLAARLETLSFADLAGAGAPGQPPDPAGPAGSDPFGPGAAARVMAALAALMRHAGGGAAPAAEELRLLAGAVSLFRAPAPAPAPASEAEEARAGGPTERGRAEADRVFDILSLVVTKGPPPGGGESPP